MKNILIISTLIWLLFTVASCKKEAILTPTEKPELAYNLPQGNHAFDQRILDYYKRFGTYILYEFTKKDAYWSVLNWDSTYRVVPAEPNYIDQQLTLIDTTFFRYYQDSTLKKYLPLKLLLCSSIKMAFGNELDCYLTSTTATGYVFETFIANWGSARIENIKGVQDSAVLFRGNINYAFLRLLDLKNLTGKSGQFIASTDYITAMSFTDPQPDRYKRGFMSGTGSYAPSNQTDWYNYIQAIVQNPYSYLTDAGTTPNDATLKGVLSPVKDVNGLIRRKYDLIVNFYKQNYNIDLQRIGNGE